MWIVAPIPKNSVTKAKFDEKKEEKNKKKKRRGDLTSFMSKSF